jgi:secreted trypsin-like serine protease
MCAALVACSAKRQAESRSPFELKFNATATLSDADPVDDDGEFPGVGALVYTDHRGVLQVHCSAIELDSTRILTAAHCFSSIECFTGNSTTYGANTYRFVTGKSARYPETSTAVVSWVIHDNFVPQSCTADLAIATLGADAPRPAGLLSTADIALPPYNQEIVKVGYGWYSERREPNGALRPAGWRAKATMIVTGPEAPQTAGYYSYAPSERRTSQICSADSGGPAFHDDGAGRTLVGITSNGAPSGYCRTDPRDTTLATYREWIVAHER